MHPGQGTLFEKCLAAALEGPQGSPRRKISCISLDLGDYKNSLAVWEKMQGKTAERMNREGLVGSVCLQVHMPVSSVR